MRIWILAFFLSALTSHASAQDISLSFPVACELGNDCFLQQYMDHDPSGRAFDYQCAPLSYDGHKGTDIALKSYHAMNQGVAVIAAAPGRVRAVRDGVDDVLYDGPDPEVEGRECGNGVIVEHADNWSTQYCHLKKGSLTRRPGDTVRAGTKLGEIGLSGRTAFPHLHLTVRKGRRVVDPFWPSGLRSCVVNRGDFEPQTLWQTPLPYQPGGILETGFAPAMPEFEEVKAGAASRARISADASSLIVFAHIFGGRRGDVVTLKITSPEGDVLQRQFTLRRTQARLFRAFGQRGQGPWPQGLYRGETQLLRDGAVISTSHGVVEISGTREERLER